MSCDGKCACCQAKEHKPQPGEATGTALIGRIATTFLLPLIVAIIGATLLRHNPHLQALGAVGGLILGCFFSVLICKVVKFGEK